MLPLRLMSREEWSGAPAPPVGPPLQPPVDYVVVTMETPTQRCYDRDQCAQSLKQLHKYYVTDRGMSEIPFNFLIGDDGTVYEARGWRAPPSRALRAFWRTHGRRIDIAFIGDYGISPYSHHMSDGVMDIAGVGIEKGIVNRFFETLEVRDNERMREALVKEKRHKAWENWEWQEIAQKIFNREMEYWEVHDKMKNFIPEENCPSNEWLSETSDFPDEVPDNLAAVHVVCRKAWDALPPQVKRLERSLAVPVRYIWFSSTGGSYCTNRLNCTAAVQSIQIGHMDELELPDIKHNFIIGGDGRVYEGRGWAHPPEKDVVNIPQSIYTGLNIAFTGDREKDNLPTDIQINAVENFIKNAQRGNFISKYYVFNRRQCIAQLIKKFCF